MIYFVYAWKSKMQNAFARPFYQTENPDVASTLVKRDLQVTPLKDLYKFKDMDLYVLGTFDDEAGRYENHCQMLISWDSIVPVIRQKEMEERINQMEVSTNGEEKQPETIS